MTKALGYRSSEILFTVSNKDEESSYYNGVNEQYVVTRGYITYLLHPKMFFLYKLRHVFRFRKLSKNLSISKLFKFMNNGKNMARSLS